MNADEAIKAICASIRASAEYDIVSFAEVREIIQNVSGDFASPIELFARLLPQLFKSGLEIGYVVQEAESYVAFIGWKGRRGEKVKRAISRLTQSSADDFAFWFALTHNVDRYEA